ncbi:MAG: hypothetical protein CMH82_08085, partial [Nocardioides sp.]|nr:hypothetical protein [Nocardioides sp.]
MRLSRPLVGLATVAVLATGALSGCGVADAGVRPGAAAVVEGEEISLGEVDDATTATCEVLQGSADLLAGGFTGAELRGIVVQQLVVTEVAEAIAAANDLPALALVAVAGWLLLQTDRRRTLAIFLPAVLLMLVAFMTTNLIATGGWKPFYAYFGTDKYLWTVDGQHSYWLNPQGIDRGGDSTTVYLLHCLV